MAQFIRAWPLLRLLFDARDKVGERAKASNLRGGNRSVEGNGALASFRPHDLAKSLDGAGSKLQILTRRETRSAQFRPSSRNLAKRCHLFV